LHFGGSLLYIWRFHRAANGMISGSLGGLFGACFGMFMWMAWELSHVFFIFAPQRQSLPVVVNHVNTRQSCGLTDATFRVNIVGVTCESLESWNLWILRSSACDGGLTTGIACLFRFCPFSPGTDGLSDQTTWGYLGGSIQVVESVQKRLCTTVLMLSKCRFIVTINQKVTSLTPHHHLNHRYYQSSRKRDLRRASLSGKRPCTFLASS
jgi:hypothetical protein